MNNEERKPEESVTEEQETKKAIIEKKEQSAMWLALNIAWELGYLIVIPIVILGFGGAYADKKFGTSPLFLLIGIVISFIITTVGAYRKIAVITSQINNVK